MNKKYPRTFHVLGSPGVTRDDRVMYLGDYEALIAGDIVITEKLDGSNLAMNRHDLFARSHSSAPTHPSFDSAKALHAAIKQRIPSGITLFGEYCYAVHSIEYDNLPASFFLFGVRDDDSDVWQSWQVVEFYANALELVTVPVIGYSKSEIPSQQQESFFGSVSEGYVIRNASGFRDEYFHKNVAKWVRADHVQTDVHWKNSWVPQKNAYFGTQNMIW